jgi:hypothetical protein
MLMGALNRYLDLQRFEGLFICDNYPQLLSSLDRRFTSLHSRTLRQGLLLLRAVERRRMRQARPP